MSSLLVGLRVLHAQTRQPGLVIGKPESIGYRRSLVPVAIEGTTRTEYWILKHVIVRPVLEQFPAMGGEFRPRRGYPLNL